MALNEIERSIAEQVKSQGGTKEDFIEVLKQYRKQSNTSKETQTIQDSKQSVDKIDSVKGETDFERLSITPSVMPGVATKGRIDEIAKDSTEKLKLQKQESEEGLQGFVSESGKSLKGRSENIKNIIKRKSEDLKRIQEKEGNIGLAKEIFTSGNPIFQALDLSENIRNDKDIPELQIAGQLVAGAGDIIWEGVENIVQDATPEDAEVVIEGLVSKVGENKTVQNIAEKWNNFKQNNPEKARNIEALVNVSEIIPISRGVKVLKGKGIPEETQKSVEAREKAQSKVEQFIKPTKITTKQQVKQIGPELLEKLKSGELEVGEREFLQKQGQEQISRLGKEIDNFIKSGKVKGDIELDNLITALSEADQGLRIDGTLLPGNESASNFIDKQIKFLSELESKYGNTLPAEKQIELRRLYDVVFDKAVTRDKITKFQDDLQVKLADELRKELAKNNPDLSSLNKDYSFYKTLDNLLEETNLRTVGQDETGLINTIRQATQGTVGSGVGAAIGGSLFGIPGATVFAVLGGSTSAKLSNIINSPKYKLLSAKKKSELADAIASGDSTKLEKILNTIIIGQSAETSEEE